MAAKKCRVCDNDFFKEPLLSYENMPRAAQFMPGKADLANEKGAGLTVCQCSGCGLVQLSGEPVPYYKEVVRAAAFSGDMKDFRVKQFADIMQKYSLKDKKVIEIGCGRGEYLAIIKQCGMDAHGLEYSEASVLECTKKNLKASKGFIESGNRVLKDAPFDAFFILSFLEHLPDPNSLLRGIWNNLADGGVGLVEVPNFNMIIKNKLFAEFIGDHLAYFTKETLAETLKLNGFDVIECREIWYDYIISAVVKKRRKLDISDFNDHQARLKKDVEGYISRFENKKVAIWGAGHQAFAIISLLNLGGRIKYVVDSATFKQGKFTPATHVPIVSPDALDQDPVDAVIVMAGGYSDEVEKIIRRKYGGTLDVMVLGGG